MSFLKTMYFLAPDTVRKLTAFHQTSLPKAKWPLNVATREQSLGGTFMDAFLFSPNYTHTCTYTKKNRTLAPDRVFEEILTSHLANETIHFLKVVVQGCRDISRYTIYRDILYLSRYAIFFVILRYKCARE